MAQVARTYDPTRTGYDPARTGDVTVAIAERRISWGAVFAGVIIVLIVQFVLSLLGVGIGASTIEAWQLGGTLKASGFGIGAGVWWLVCSTISVFAGGWVAGRLAGMPDRTDGMLHGLVAWGLAMLLLIYLLTTAVSNLVGGAFGVVGSATRTAGQGAQVAAQPPGLLALFQQYLQQLPGQARQQAGQQIQQLASDETVRQVVQKAVTAEPENLSEADRQAAIDALVQHTTMTRPEAEQWLAQWQQSYQQAKQQALLAAQATADTVSEASLLSFVALLLGAIAAAGGGMLASSSSTTVAFAQIMGGTTAFVIQNRRLYLRMLAILVLLVNGISLILWYVCDAPFTNPFLNTLLFLGAPFLYVMPDLPPMDTLQLETHEKRSIGV